MSRFVIHISEQKRKRDLLWARINIAISIGCLAMLVYYLFVDSDTVSRAFYICFAINFGWSGYDKLKKTKRKEFFLEICETELRWQMHRTGRPETVQWNDIRWIKKDHDNAILISRESSFSAGFLLEGFQETEKMQILGLIEKYSNEHQIRLINFSEPTFALA